MTAVDRSDIEASLRRLDEMEDELRLGMRRNVRAMRTETEDLEQAVLEGITDHGDVEPLCVLRWCARSSGWRSADIRLPPPRELRFIADAFMAQVDGRSTERLAAMRVFQSEHEA